MGDGHFNDGIDARDPCDIEIERLQQRVQELELQQETMHDSLTKIIEYNNFDVVETSVVTLGDDKMKSLEYAKELMEIGDKASKEEDYDEAIDCYSRALEIRAAFYGELAPECVRSYYKYGCALLCKAQEESDPLVSRAVSKKESAELGDKGSANGAESGESSVFSSDEEDQEEDAEGSDDEEDESDLDLAWEMLDVAKAIAEKQPGDAMEKVDILSALAEVALEREDVKTSLGDYLEALSMLKRLVKPDSRHIAELNFRICLCLEIGQKVDEAISYCQKAISVCKSHLQRLTGEIESSSSSKASANPDSVADKEEEIEILMGLSSDLEKKLEDLQQSVSNPSSVLSEILRNAAAKANGGQTSAPASASAMTSRIGTADSSGFESTVSTAHTNGAFAVTHLGVVGRGVKRVNMSSVARESTANKKQASDPSADNGGSA